MEAIWQGFYAKHVSINVFRQRRRPLDGFVILSVETMTIRVRDSAK